MSLKEASGDFSFHAGNIGFLMPKDGRLWENSDKGDPHMVDAKVIEAVNYFRELVEKGGIRIHTLILFGSSSSGTATRGSDIDIAIISDDFTGKDIFDRALQTKEAEIHTVRKFKVPLDVITLTTEEYRNERSLLSRMIRKGIILSTAPPT